MNRSRIGAVAVLTVVAGLASLASPAGATFHDVQIRALFRGPVANTGFIELQMTSAGQNFVSGQNVRVYTATAMTNTAFPIPGNVGIGQNQRTILIGDTATANSPDFVTSAIFTTMNNLAAGGALCYGTIDCVSWGSFTGDALLPVSAGTPSGPLLTNQVTARTITRGCATALDAADDTNNSAADFGYVVGFQFRNNAATPTETVCPTTTPSKKKKCKKKRKKKGGGTKDASAAKKKKCKKKKKKK